MAPHFSKPSFLAEFHPGMVVDILFFQKWHLALGHAQPGPGTGPVWGPLGAHGRAGGGRAYGGSGSMGPMQGLGPWDPFGGARRPWRPKADIMEAEGRLNGGLGAKPPGILAVFFNA